MTSLAEIVKELDWDFGDFIPVANDENRELEIIFQSRFLFNYIKR